MPKKKENEEKSEKHPRSKNLPLHFNTPDSETLREKLKQEDKYKGLDEDSYDILY